MKRDNKRA